MWGLCLRSSLRFLLNPAPCGACSGPRPSHQLRLSQGKRACNPGRCTWVGCAPWCPMFPASLFVRGLCAAPFSILPRNGSASTVLMAVSVFFFCGACLFPVAAGLLCRSWALWGFLPDAFYGSFLSSPMPVFSSPDLGPGASSWRRWSTPCRARCSLCFSAAFRISYAARWRLCYTLLDQKNSLSFSEIATTLADGFLTHFSSCSHQWSGPGSATVLFPALWAAIGSHGVPRRTFSELYAC